MFYLQELQNVYLVVVAGSFKSDNSIIKEWSHEEANQLLKHSKSECSTLALTELWLWKEN